MSGPAENQDGGTRANSSLRAALADATDRLQAVLDEAEATAARILEEAEARARLVLEEAEAESRRRAAAAARETHGLVPEGLPALRGLVADVVRGAEAVAREAEALRSAASRLEATLAGPSAQGETVPLDPMRAGQAVSSPTPTGSGVAQLRAVQMAVGGLEDREIERRLRQEFGSEDVSRALDVLRRLESRP